MLDLLCGAWGKPPHCAGPLFPPKKHGEVTLLHEMMLVKCASNCGQGATRESPVAPRCAFDWLPGVFDFEK